MFHCFVLIIQEDLVTNRQCLLLDAASHMREKRIVCDPERHVPDRKAALGAQAAGEHIRTISEQPRRLLDAGFGFLCDIALLAQGTRHRSAGNPGVAGNV
jgi:hypothetical protein